MQSDMLYGSANLNASRKTLLSIIAKAYRIIAPKSGLTRLAFNKPMNNLIGKGKIAAIASTRSGDRIQVDLNDYDGRVLYLFGTNDPKVEASVRALLRPGQVFLDIGANHGSIGFAAADVVGTDGHVHLFEPQSRLNQALDEVLGKRAVKNVTVHPIGLLDRDATLELRSPDQHTGMASFAQATDFGADVRAETCQVKAIHSYIPPLIAGHAFGVKLDVEGVEPAILPWLVNQDNLAFIICEVAQNRSEILGALWSAGLATYGLVKSPLILQLKRFVDEDGSLPFHDILAVRMARHSELPASSTPAKLGKLLQR